MADDGGMNPNQLKLDETQGISDGLFANCHCNNTEIVNLLIFRNVCVCVHEHHQ